MTQQKRQTIGRAFQAAFPYTIPILAGFLFLGITYGIYMRVSGFSFWYPMVMSLTIFAGSVEFVAANLLLGAFNPLQALALTLMINARHLFYGISMLDKYKNTGWKKFYLIFGMCDESFSINYTANIPADVDKSWFMFFVTLLNHCYWVVGAHPGRPVWRYDSVQHRRTGLCAAGHVCSHFSGSVAERKKSHQRHSGTGLVAFVPAGLWPQRLYHSIHAGDFAVLTLLRKPLEKGGDPQ